VDGFLFADDSDIFTGNIKLVLDKITEHARMEVGTQKKTRRRVEQHQVTFTERIGSMNTTIVTQPEVQSMLSIAEQAQAIGEMDSAEGYPFCPEFYFIDYVDKCNYAQGFASVRGHSYLTDPFLVGSAVASIEDDYEFIRHGGA
jgi:hypothetical protein